MDGTSTEAAKIDESSLRKYFRRVLGVSPGAGRRELRQARDRACTRLRDLVLSKEGEERSHCEKALATVNLAHDCLASADKFRDYYSRLSAGETRLEEVETYIAEALTTVKPPPATQVERRQAHTAERMERIKALVADAIRNAAAAESKRQTALKLPQPDEFYDGVYKAAFNAGEKVKSEELAAVQASSKFLIDDSCLQELQSFLEDSAEVAAHKEYDHLEALVAQEPPPATKERITASMLVCIILCVVAGYAFFALNHASDEPIVVNLPTEQEVAACETASDASLHLSKDPVIAGGGRLVNSAGAAGLAGPATDLTKPGAVEYQSGLKNAMNGQLTEALAEFDRCARTSYSTPEALYNKAALLAAAKDRAGALRDYSELLKTKPAFVQGYYNRGLVHQDTADALYSTALNAGGNSAAYEPAAKELQAALANYDLAIRVEPKMAQAYYNKGIVLYRFGELAKAKECFKKAFSILSIMAAADYNARVAARDLNEKVDLPAAVPAAPVGPIGPEGPKYKHLN